MAFVASCIRRLPWPVVAASGEAIGFAVYLLDVPRRRIAVQNLAHAFPTRTPAWRRRVSRRVFSHFGRMLLELLKFSTLTADDMLSRVEFEGADRARQAYAAGHGAFFLTAHFGCWETNGLVHALNFAPIGVMARPLDNPMLHEMLERVRQCTGNWVIYRKGGIRKTLRALE